MCLCGHSTLCGQKRIIVTATGFQKFQRHRLHLLTGNLLQEGPSRILYDVHAGKTGLVCANSVRRARCIHKRLRRRGLTSKQVILIYSRYMLKHRMELEAEIHRSCGVGVSIEPCVLVVTQVVEVSLNIDLDTIYTDPAPLEALLQRFWSRQSHLSERDLSSASQGMRNKLQAMRQQSPQYVISNRAINLGEEMMRKCQVVPILGEWSEQATPLVKSAKVEQVSA
ncbi:hypothetical protein [Ktedonobacter racemifer]|uniref:hypothetical protein n=1 Tax=Ktedonobacter racemifer TaxID=363277 RepID=UPI003B75C379